MIPPRREFEKVKVDEWISGDITDIQYEQEHEFSYKGNKSKGMAARIIFNLDGYKDRKQTGWMGFSYSEKSTLYRVYLSALVEGAKPNMNFDLDLLKNLRIKVMYAQNGEYQNVVMVRPLQDKILPGSKLKATPDEEVPF